MTAGAKKGDYFLQVKISYMILTPLSLLMCTFLNVGDSNRVSSTEISLAPQEFDDYQIGIDVAITFCLKELRVNM